MSNEENVKLAEWQYPCGRHEIIKRKINYPILVMGLTIIIAILIILLTVAALKLTKNKAENAYLEDRVVELQKSYDKIKEENAAKKQAIANLKSLISKIQIWNSEISKPLGELDFDDFSKNPIEDTPDIYREKFVEESKKYGVPASLITAQAMIESSFRKTASYFGGNESRIINWKQEEQNGEYNIYVVYKNTNKWVLYGGEFSIGLAQINLTAHKKVSVQQAYDPNYSIQFICDRWDMLLQNYPNKSPLFIAMAYNTPGAAIKGESLLNNASLSSSDRERAVFILKYGEKVLTLAREQRLKEIYDELFTPYLVGETALYIPHF